MNCYKNSHSLQPFFIILSLLLLYSPLFSAKWLQKESEHFVVIYKPAHAYLVPHIITAAEASLEKLQQIFDYQPSEKIYINTYDFSDYGSAGTTTVPENYIRLQIEPIELGYESMPFQERFQWLISHELVHIVVNDKATRAEKFFRSLFSKVPPQNIQPLSIFYSLLTNRTRYSPRWHQEGIAVFMETWLNGGFGRVLGNFDEMYFRSLVYEQQPIPSEKILDAKVSYESFLVETLFYLYGARFDAYLASQYGYQKLIDWYRAAPGDFYRGFEKKFKKIFGISFGEGWQGFIENEIAFQQKNIQRLKKSPLTRIDAIPDTPSGWVTSAYPEPGQHAMVFGYHQAHHLTAIARLNLNTGAIEHLGSLPSPSILQIASTAYDNNLKLLFYTANNNKLFRDIYVLSTASKKNKLLFPDCRVGQITVSPTTHELWGIQHYAGKSTLVYSAYPYRELIPVVGFNVGDNLQQLSVSPSGRYLAAILHQASGRQALIVSDLQQIRDGKNFSFKVISQEGSPGNPSWSPDEAYIYWNAYINGVSNIYRYDTNSGEILPFSNTIRGLFKPLYLNDDSLFAFEFTSHGFHPVIIPNQPAERLSAIEYFGQQVVDKNSEVTQWALPVPQPIQSTKDTLDGVSPFQPLKHLRIQSFIPVVTGFQSQVAVGVYAQISDPLLSNFFTVEAAVTPKRENFLQPRFHLKVKYEYMRKYIFSFSHNAPNFYDLLNDRKQGMIGNKITAGYRKFFKYDIPHKIELASEAALYTGIEAINDNLVKVTRPDFIVLQSALKSNNVRRAIGSIDHESGSEWAVTGMFFGVEPRRVTVVGGFHAAVGYYKPFWVPHNIFHIKLSTGYRYTKPYLSIGKFYFGGFGNRIVDRANVKQYRKVFRFPGIPIYSLPGDRFVKLMIEHNLPPFRPGKLFLGEHYLSNINFSWYSQGLWIHSPQADLWGDLGAQLNFVFNHWFNLQSTVSVGAARAWSRSGNNWEWFISVKLLKH